MLKTIQLIMLRRKARRLVTRVYAEMSGLDCGSRLTLVMRPYIWDIAKRADEVLERIEQLDPSAPNQRVTTMLKEIAA